MGDTGGTNKGFVQIVLRGFGISANSPDGPLAKIQTWGIREMMIPKPISWVEICDSNYTPELCFCSSLTVPTFFFPSVWRAKPIANITPLA